MGGPRHVVPPWLDLGRLDRTQPREGWDRNAACRDEDLDLFFAEKGEQVKVHAAKAICRRCPAVYACLAANLDEDHGTFGRTSPEERKAIRKDMALLQRGAA